MTFRHIAACTLALALAGCAATTQQGMRERGAALQQSSAKPTTEIIGCVSKTWDERGMAFNYTPRTDGGQLLVRISYLPVMMLDVVDRGDTREASFYLFKSMWSKQNRARVEEIKACL